MMNKVERNLIITGWFITGLYYSVIGEEGSSEYYIDSAVCLFENTIDEMNKAHYE